MSDKYRMYGLVPYNLSPIQQGIQFGHAVVEYGLKYGSNPEYKHWAKNCKTFIILNGGTTSYSPNKFGSLNDHGTTLLLMNVKHTIFNEPDLGDQLTAVVFLVDERVYDKKKYPEMSQKSYRSSYMIDYWKQDTFGSVAEANKILEMREFLSQFRLA